MQIDVKPKENKTDAVASDAVASARLNWHIRAASNFVLLGVLCISSCLALYSGYLWIAGRKAQQEHASVAWPMNMAADGVSQCINNPVPGAAIYSPPPCDADKHVGYRDSDGAIVINNFGLYVRGKTKWLSARFLSETNGAAWANTNAFRDWANTGCGAMGPDMCKVDASR